MYQMEDFVEQNGRCKDEMLEDLYRAVLWSGASPDVPEGCEIVLAQYDLRIEPQFRPIGCEGLCRWTALPHVRWIADRKYDSALVHVRACAHWGVVEVRYVVSITKSALGPRVMRCLKYIHFPSTVMTKGALGSICRANDAV